MVQEVLHQLFTNAKFTAMYSDIREVVTYYRDYEQSICMIHVCNYMDGQNIDIFWHRNIIRQIHDYFTKKGYLSIAMLSIILTTDVNKARFFAESDYGIWIIDCTMNRLMIYENQPEDFLSIKVPLENLLEESVKPKKRYPTLSLINTILILSNIIVFFILQLMGDTRSVVFMVNHGAMFTEYIVNRGEVYRLFTAMFMHFSYMHLFGNMIILAILGDNLERAYGKLRYLVIYIVSGLGASICTFLYNLAIGNKVVGAGASGAIFGVIGALLFTVWKNKGRLENVTLYRLALLIIYILYNGITTTGVDNAAHIGGLLIGILLSIVLYPGEGTVKERKRIKV